MDTTKEIEIPNLFDETDLDNYLEFCGENTSDYLDRVADRLRRRFDGYLTVSSHDYF